MDGDRDMKFICLGCGNEPSWDDDVREPIRIPLDFKGKITMRVRICPDCPVCDTDKYIVMENRDESG